jgi:TonB family protein
MYRFIFLISILLCLGCDTMEPNYEGTSTEIELTQYSDLDQQAYFSDEPIIVKAGEVQYPRLAIQAGLEPTVWVKAYVDFHGKVTKAKIFKPCRSKVGFNEAALQGVNECEFAPFFIRPSQDPFWVICRVEWRLENGIPKTQIIVERWHR